MAVEDKGKLGSVLKSAVLGDRQEFSHRTSTLLQIMRVSAPRKQEAGQTQVHPKGLQHEKSKVADRRPIPIRLQVLPEAVGLRGDRYQG